MGEREEGEGKMEELLEEALRASSHIGNPVDRLVHAINWVVDDGEEINFPNNNIDDLADLLREVCRDYR
jgi:hypothetical protein